MNEINDITLCWVTRKKKEFIEFKEFIKLKIEEFIEFLDMRCEIIYLCVFVLGWNLYNSLDSDNERSNTFFNYISNEYR